MRQIFERLLPTLRRKIAFAVFSVMVLAGGLFVYIAHQTGYTMLEQQSEIKAKGIADILTDILEREMVEGDKDHMKRTLLSVTASHDIVNAYMLKRDGAVSVQADDQDTVKQFALDQFQDVEGREGDKYLTARENERLFEYVAIPVMNKPECVTCHQETNPVRGYIAVKLSVDDIRALASRHRAANLIMTVLTFGFIGLIIYLALSWLIIVPVGTLHFHIKRVEEGIKQMESGERTTFPLLPEPVSKDEIAELNRDINKLVSRLNEGNAKLIEMHQLQLEQAARLASVGEMAASMAHEIKNPIAGVLGAVQVFENELLPDDSRKEIFSEMKVQLERVNRAVTDLLTFARPTPPVYEEVHINDVIRRTQTMLSKQINDRQIEVKMNLADNANSLAADKKQLQQALWNVMLNGIQAMERPGILTITSARSNGSVVLTVSDTGKGIPSENIDEVFKPFFTTKHKGTGLGMTIMKRIVEQHHGTIRLESEVGKGTTVSVVLPQHQKKA